MLHQTLFLDIIYTIGIKILFGRTTWEVDVMSPEEIKKRLITNDALFRNMFVFEQQFDILPEGPHIGAAIAYQDIKELRQSFLGELIDTMVDWVYSSEKYDDLLQKAMATGKSKGAASSEVRRRAAQKFRKAENNLLAQGQLGELLLFHFIQRAKGAVPLLRKMPIATSSDHERFGADAIHYKVEGTQNILILGESKAYTSKYKFSSAFEDALDSILATYENHHEELNLYLHEDFLDKEMDQIAEKYLTNQLENVKMELVSLVLYNETKKVTLNSEQEIKDQIQKIIGERFASYDKEKIDLQKHPILGRITYIVFPIWEFDKLAQEYQDMI